MDAQPRYYLCWSSAGIGRFWKRQLSKSRRRYARALCRYETGRMLHPPRGRRGIESLVNCKLW